MKDSTLNKYKRVIDEWFLLGRKDGDGTKAYMKIYAITDKESAERSFFRLLGIVRVSKYVKKLEKKERKAYKKKWKIDLADCDRVAIQMAIHGTYDWQGVELPVKPSDRKSYLEMLYKRTGAFAAEKKLIQGDKDKPIKIEATVEIFDSSNKD